MYITRLSDQITVKIHKFAKKYAEDTVKLFKKAGIPITETAIFDIAVSRLKDELDQVNWESEKSRNEFIQGFIDDLMYLQQHKIIKVKMRNIPKEVSVKK